MEKAGWYHLNQVNNISNGTNQNCIVIPCNENLASLLWSSHQRGITWMESWGNTRQPKLKDINKITGLTSSKESRPWKSKKGWGSGSDRRRLKEQWFSTGFFCYQGHHRDNWKNWKRVWRLDGSNVSMFMSWFWWLCCGCIAECPL